MVTIQALECFIYLNQIGISSSIKSGFVEDHLLLQFTGVELVAAKKDYN